MAVTIKDVEHVAKLARLEFTEEEKKMFTRQLNQILEYMEKLNELDTTSVEPLSHVIELSPADLRSRREGGIFRQDKVRPSYPAEEILKNAAAKTEKFFKVPKVIGDR